MSTDENGSGSGRDKQYCVLFYKYHPLTDNAEILETYRRATETLCASLRLTGRVLIGLSDDGEGINGTLAGTRGDLDAYVRCMLGRERTDDAARADDALDGRRRADAVDEFGEASRRFFAGLGVPELLLDGPEDFKWSSWSDPSSSLDDGESWFPDLNVKIVKEIISSGGAFAGISSNDTAVGYLTPREWHEEIQLLIKKKERSSDDRGKTECEEEDADTILIDVRNHKECQIGSFAPGISIDPQTKTFAQFPRWAESEKGPLKNKRILMYCTGGIRCEKASAYIRQVVPENKGIYHLKGGIHKYLEEFGQGATPAASNNNGSDIDGIKHENNGVECLFVGKNFVFDRRGALDAKGHGIEKDDDPRRAKSDGSIIGKCQYCSDPYDAFHPENVCTVCREPILVCEKCQSDLRREQRSLRGLASSTEDGDSGDGNDSEEESGCRVEYHCQDHFHLNTCYFTSLHGFEKDELRNQMEQLQRHSKQLEGLGKKGKQRRRTLRKQMDKIEAFIKEKLSNVKGKRSGLEPAMQCRHCGLSTCKSDCWGFHGGKTRMETKKGKNQGGDKQCDNKEPNNHKQRTRVPSNQRPAKRLKRQNDIAEIEVLQLSNPPSRHRSDVTGLRAPPPVVRLLRSGVKGRWCGKTVRWVMNNEFGDWHNLPQEERDERLEELIAAGLIRINGISISKMFESTPTSSSRPAGASDIVLRNMDTLERIVHWHEPPISIPFKISLTKHMLPDSTISSNGETTASPLLYCIDKPSSVPIYPAGPYYANSLLMMVEAQEGLPPKTLIPLHRIDRATSGVLLCANTSSVARVVQGRMTSSAEDEYIPPVRKLYLARVRGRFPDMSSECPTIPKECEGIASIAWSGNEKNIIEVNAPIAVQLSTTKDGCKDGEENSSNAMMHRTVREDGKQSISRFKLISYDSFTNQSLVSCCPITGRGHQLRVHLELIGYPIHNDVEYGGAAIAESRNEQERVSVQSMLDVSMTTKECLRDKAVTADEVKSAVRLCRFCSRGMVGIKACFNSSQLLGCGHAIDLHAYKYRISFRSNRRKEANKSIDVSCGEAENIISKRETSMEFAAGLPSWASSFFPDLTPTLSVSWLN